MNTLMAPKEIQTLKKEMDRVFDRVLIGDWFSFARQGEWYPPLDLTETPEAVLCRVDVPGVDPKDLHVTLNGEMLMIRGERTAEFEDTNENRFHLDRQFGAFSRSIRLPVAVDANKVTATFKNGALTIRILKSEKFEQRAEIPIKIT